MSFYLPEIGPGRLYFVYIGLVASEASGSWIGKHVDWVTWFSCKRSEREILLGFGNFTKFNVMI